MFEAFFDRIILIIGLLFLINTVHSYNIDTRDPVVYEDLEPGGENFFGYTVTLKSGRNIDRNSDPAIFIGAPKLSGGVGGVYRCRVSGDRGNASSCQTLGIDPKSAPEMVQVPGKKIAIKSKGYGGWLGAAMATQDYADLTVCGPRSTVSFVDQLYGGVVFMDDMRGVCYDLPQASGNTLYRDSQILVSYTFPIKSEINALYGFSISYAERRSPNNVARIIGEPRINQVEILHSNKTVTRSHDVNELSNLGYAVSTGYYFDRNQVMFAAGAPAWLCKGMVAVFEANSPREKRIEGSNLGEYFGASLTSGDFNGDGYDDLAVGAPHWGEVDYGRVYTFYSHDDGTFKEGLVLQGKHRSGLFGYTLASADLDNDGNSDLVVGAPWEQESGAVHVFYGNTRFGTKDRLAPVSQTILPSDFAAPLATAQRFGFALASPVDVDGNGYPDLAVGAFKSGQAFLLRSKSVVSTQVSLHSTPATLQKSTLSFVLHVCINYYGRSAPMSQGLRLEMTVDEEHRRVTGGTTEVLEALFRRNEDVCANTTFFLTHGNTNFVDPIVIRVKHSIPEDDKSCSSCPVLRKPSGQENAQLTVPFNTGCKDGSVCNASLSVTANFAGVRENDEWVVGSGDINFSLRVTNEGEPAYLTQLTIEIPAGIGLKNAIPSCIEVLEGSSLTLICDIDNPLEKGDTKDLTVGLDMSHLTKSVGGRVLTFVVSRSTRSRDNVWNNPVYKYLTLKNEASVRISGVSNEESRDYAKTEDKSAVPLRHAYQILKFGATPVTEAFLFVDVPVGILGRNDTFLNISAPKLESSGQTYECLANGGRIDWRSVSAAASAEAAYALLQKRRRRAVEEEEEEEVGGTASPGVGFPTDAVFAEGNRVAESNAEATESAAAARGTGKTVYLNCSSDEVTCASIKCRFGLLQTTEDMGNLVLDMVFNAKTFYESDDDPLTVKFNTNATVVIIQPLAPEPVNYSRIASAGASTMLYNIPQPQKLAGWILPGSIICGVFLFLILAVILYAVGFFKRPKKVETEKAKEMEMILKKDNADDPFG
ncbi:integrin alpha-PS5-like [Athalia rosae]|uniref:integrin alpha-PS5-like n=1 Tax=Athalia rosae TaxID=37344 RepID=UPI0020338C29|nr:integrin alpha-PS5-like [Athalia rosae]